MSLVRNFLFLCEINIGMSYALSFCGYSLIFKNRNLYYK